MTNRVNTGTNNGGSGILIAAGGTAVEPSYSFWNNPTTGIYNPTSTSIAFVGGTVERLRIDGDIFAKNSANFVGSTGTNLLPSYTFTINTTTGLYNPTSTGIGFVGGTVERLRIDGDIFAKNNARFIGVGGSTTAPSYSFTGDTDTGIYTPSANAIAFVGGTVERLRIDGDIFALNSAAFVGKIGGPGSPSFTFESDGNTGIYSTGTNADEIGITTAGIQRANFNNSGIRLQAPVIVTPGTPSYSFITDTNTGIFQDGADQLGFATGGSRRVSITNNGTYFSGGGIVSGGTASLPSISFLGDSNTGIYSPAADSVTVSVGGNAAVSIETSSVTLENGIGLNVKGNLISGSGVTNAPRLNTRTGGNAITFNWAGNRFQIYVDATLVASFPNGYAP